jgi:hypothetical protein
MTRPVRCSTLILLLAAALLGGCTSGPQLRTVEQIPDKPRPADQSGVVNFEAVLMQKVASHSVYTRPKEPHLMRRLLLSPNLVFESSRSALDETGVTQATALSAPITSSASGDPVDIDLSTSLFKYLSNKGSIIIAPAVTRRGSWEGGCGNTPCPKTTWVERLIPANHKSPGPTSGRTVEPGIADQPTAALAVRRLGISHSEIDVVAVNNPAQYELLFRPRRAKGEASVCGPVTLSLPVISFMAEVISLKDGRILARIDEQRTPRFIMELKPVVVLKTWRKQTATGHTSVDAASGSPRGGEYTYVQDWIPEETGCRSALNAFRELQEEAYRQMESKLAGTVADILQIGLDPLY